MSFSQKTPKPPKPPPIPTPPSPTEAELKADEDTRRRALASQAPRSSTVMTSPLGDPGYGGQVQVAQAGGTKLSLGV